MRISPLLAASLALAFACDGSGLTVSLQKRDTVTGDLATIEIQVSSDRDPSNDPKNSFPVSSDAFPHTFTVSGGDGPVWIDVRVLGADAATTAVAHGMGYVLGDEATRLDLMLDPADFVADVADATDLDDREITFTDSLAGRQLAAGSDGSFVVVWETECGGVCELVGRRFDANGTGDDGNFVISSPDQYTAAPAVASGDGGYVAAWLNGAGSPTVRMRGFDLQAALLGNEELVPSTVTTGRRSPVVIGRPGHPFVVAWERVLGDDTLITARYFLVSGEAQPNPITDANTEFPVTSGFTDGKQQYPHGVALNGGGFVVVWTEQATGSPISRVRGRVFGPTGVQVTNDLDISADSTGTVKGPHATPIGGGFAVAWQGTAADNQPLYLQRFSSTGVRAEGHTVIAEDVAHAFSYPVLATWTGPDGEQTIVAVWKGCGSDGDGGGCGIRMRTFLPSGLPLGESVVVNTTTLGDQEKPSVVAMPGTTVPTFVVAWTDMEPEQTRIRSRLVYPQTDVRDGTIGATCGPDLPDAELCGADFTCVDGEGAEPGRCLPTCPCDFYGGVCRDGAFCSFDD